MIKYSILKTIKMSELIGGRTAGFASRFVQIAVVCILIGASANIYGEVNDRELMISGLQDKIVASRDERYREFLADLLGIVSAEPPEVEGVKGRSWTHRNAQCYTMSKNLKDALCKLGKYKIRLVLFDSEFNHAFLIIDDFSPRIIVDPTYLQNFYYSERTGLSPLFVGTTDELESIFKNYIVLLKPLNVFERMRGVKYTAKDYVHMIWGFTAEQPPRSVIEIRTKKRS